MELIDGIDIWQDKYFLNLQPSGRLAYLYTLNLKALGKAIIIEDMAKSTGLEYSEAEDYLERFEKEGRL